MSSSTSSLESLATPTHTLVETMDSTPSQDQHASSLLGGVFSPANDITEHLKIRVAPRRRQRATKSVRWSGDVVDNELLGKKSSKKCCVFHKRQEFGAWDDSDTEDECECIVP